MRLSIKSSLNLKRLPLQYSPYKKGYNMNRKKKLNSILQKRMKKINAKAAPGNKEKYISKAERAKLAEQEKQQTVENGFVVVE